jgi:hypothetical protein
MYTATKKRELVARIPVIYGCSREIEVRLLEDHIVLLSKNCSKGIVRVLRCIAPIRAPFQEGYPIGWAFYKTPIFRNWVMRSIVSPVSIGRAGRLRTICDSISYIIFGTPFASCQKKEGWNSSD